MRKLIALLAGLIFGFGLVVSDMINPARVLGFLDLFGGRWDPTLGFVMLGAVLVMAIAWVMAGKRDEPVFGGDMPGAAASLIDRRLIGGAAIFGLGWGLVGLCPGPALAGLLVGGTSVWVFIAAMILGMGVQNMARSP
ncbi:MAG: YeeE/YedE family protein [Anderseniella sp.]|nr:YeeE/YedE family protein [Anderseniella sp.]